MRPTKWVIVGLLGATVGFGLQQAGYAEQAAAPAAKPLSADDADAAILDRQLVMQALEKDVDKLGSIFAQSVPAKELAPTLQAIAKSAQEAQKSFEIMVPGGATKPEAWTDPKFAALMTQFATKSQAMVKIGETGDLAAVGVASVDALPCKQCHDLFRVPKKK